MKKKLYLHIGMFKTGSTYLQNEVFPKLIDINYLQLNNKLVNKFCMDITTKYKEEYIDISGLFDSKINLISFEGFMGDVFEPDSKSYIEIMKDLKQVFKNYDVKIMLFLRRPLPYIESMYSQYIKQGNYGSFNDFLNKFENADMIKMLDHKKLIRDLGLIFGKSNLMIYHQEAMKIYGKGYIDKLLGDIGVKAIPQYAVKDSNKAYNILQLGMASFINKHLPALNNIKIPGKAMRLPRFIIDSKPAAMITGEKFQLKHEDVCRLRKMLNNKI